MTPSDKLRFMIFGPSEWGGQEIKIERVESILGLQNPWLLTIGVYSIYTDGQRAILIRGGLRELAGSQLQTVKDFLTERHG